MNRWETLAEKAIAEEDLTREEAREILQAGPAELMPLVNAAFRVRKHFHGLKVQIHVLENAKMGGCSEDCSFCSQSARYQTGVASERTESLEELLAGARRAKAAHARRYCMVTATKGPSEKDLDVICEAAGQIKKEMDISLCASLGFLTEEKARRLAEAGVDRFNHNLETSERNFPNIVTTHTYADRVSTIRTAKRAGMEVCCGGIVGLNDTDEDVIDLAFALKDLDVDSLPVNFLNPRPGTPLGETPPMTPAYALKALCLFRFVHPRVELRAGGGREVILRSLQPFALCVSNSIFTNGYLTTGGAGESYDHEMIRDLGFEIEEMGFEDAAAHEVETAVRA